MSSANPLSGPRASARESSGPRAWSYEEAFSRNLGLVSPEEQQKLRRSRVAIAGMGGMGGIDLITLARLGVGRFTIADPEAFAVVNTNRQFGAMRSTVGRSKAEVMAELVRDINPEVELRVFTEPIGPDNADDFLRDADLFVDAIEFFEIDARRLLFRKAAAQGIYAVTAGPLGFSGIWIVFDPKGMSFDAYFDFSDDMDRFDKVVALAVGVAPKATQRAYMDLTYVDIDARTAPSCGAACHLAAGAMACEALKILLNKGKVRAAPCYHQFDAFLGRFVRGRLWGGNRHPLQRLKRWLLKKYLVKIHRQRAPTQARLGLRCGEHVPMTSPTDHEQIDRYMETLYPILGGHIYFQTLSAAVQFDLFGLLKKHGELTLAEIAERLGIELKPARILLLGCTTLGLLNKSGHNYSNTELSDRLLVPDAPGNAVPIIKWQHFISYRAMYWFYGALKENRNVGLKELPGAEPTLYQRLAHAPELEKVFQDAMEAISVQANELLAQYVDLSDVRHLVDVGGGNGANVIAIARRYPRLRATVFDSPSVCRIADENIRAAGLSDRLATHPGNCFLDPFPPGADCLLFGHFFPIWSEEQNLALLKKCYNSLPSGGRVVIFNMMQSDDENGPMSAALGSPYFLTLATGGGMLYTWKEYETWMEGAGFLSVQRCLLPRDHGAVIGVKS